MQPSDSKGAQGGLGLSLRSPGWVGAADGVLAGSAGHTFIEPWEEWVSRPRPSCGRVHSRDREQNASVSQETSSSAWCLFPAPLSRLGSSVLTFVSPFGLSFPLQMCAVPSSLGKPGCIVGLERQRSGGPAEGIQCAALTAARLGTLRCVGGTGWG